MAGLNSKMSGVASRLINKYGTDITITRPVVASFDPATQKATAGTPLTDSIKAVLEDYKAHEVNGDTVRYGDKKLMIPKSDLTNLSEPAPNDTIDALGTVFRVISVDGVSSGDGIVAYRVQVRK